MKSLRVSQSHRDYIQINSDGKYTAKGNHEKEDDGLTLLSLLMHQNSLIRWNERWQEEGFVIKEKHGLYKKVSCPEIS